MFNRVTLMLALAIMFLVVGGAFALTSGDVQAKSIRFQTSVMTETGEDGMVVPGAATLTRSKKAISYKINTTELTPGHVYTIWTVIFNRPENCDGDCSGPDLSVAKVRGSVVFGGSYIADANGTGNFNDSLAKGSPPAGIQVNVPAGTANGLINPMKAEIHLVLRTHGAPDATRSIVQLSTFEEQGLVEGDPCPAPDCVNVQFAAFPGP